MLRSFNFKYWISCLPYNCLKSLSSLATGIKENKLLGSSEKKCRNTNTILYMTLTKKGNSSNKKTSNFHETIQFKVNTCHGISGLYQSKYCQHFCYCLADVNIFFCTFCHSATIPVNEDDWECMEPLLSIVIIWPTNSLGIKLAYGSISVLISCTT